MVIPSSCLLHVSEHLPADVGGDWSSRPLGKWNRPRNRKRAENMRLKCERERCRAGHLAHDQEGLE